MDEIDSIYNNQERKEKKYTRCSYCHTFNRASVGDTCLICRKGVME